MPTLRKLVFWSHLVCGLDRGRRHRAIMSATGVAITFEHELLDWLDRDVARVTVSPAGTAPKPLAELQARRRPRSIPAFKVTTILVPRDPDRRLHFSRRARPPRSTSIPTPVHRRRPEAPTRPTTCHRGPDRVAPLARRQRRSRPPSARLVTGVCNAAFLGLCLTGLWLWFPRKWSRRALRPLVWFVGDYRGKARDFNWHNVLGLWSAPALIVLTATGVVISFGWAHNLVFHAAGEQPSKFRDFRMMAVAVPTVSPVSPRMPRLELDAIHARLLREFPTAESIAYTLQTDVPSLRPLDVAVFEPAMFSTAGRVMTYVDPFRGDVLSATRFSDRSAGLQARVWIRFLHTGEAFGLTGKIIAAATTAASLVLIWTGFALSWRRFSSKRKHQPQAT
jgi:uncharacterized iron-regulated membrane protein